MIETSIMLSFSTWLSTKIVDKGFDIILSKLSQKENIDQTFTKIIKAVSKRFEDKYPEVLGNSMSYFFTQTEVFDELCKLLFINQNVNTEVIGNYFDNSTLPKNFIVEFINELKIELAKEPTFFEIISNKELYIAVKGISKDVEEISINSTLSTQEIIEIKKILENQFRDKFNLENFKSDYIKNLINNISELNFIGLGIDPSIKKGKRKQLDSIFVKPFFRFSSEFHRNKETKKNKEKKILEESIFLDEEEELITFKNLFDRPYNYVILGNPGSGKSLLIKSIILYISSKQKEFNNNDIFTYIPFRLELKSYLSYKKLRGGNILKYLTSLLEEEYSITGILEENLSKVLKDEKSILFFDGLDEIFNVSDKINIKNDIENFHNLFPKIKSITTSRHIGYNEAKLNEENFCELNILSFNLGQIKEYVSRWYSLEEENIETRNLEISDFVSKMNSVDQELLSNPLLLSLIVILYRNNLKIPDSKLEIYQSCTNTLVDKWDASKNLDIQIDHKILQKKEVIFSDLAFWQYEVLSSSEPEITYYKVKTIVSKSLLRKKVADDDNCGQLADIFLTYALNRSIYFDNNFTHKTFLEYYTAFWIYSNIEMKHKIQERNEIIKKYITNPFWSIVLELLFNMIDKDQPDSEILDGIIMDNIEISESYPFLIYIIPNLKNISKEVQEKVYYKTIIYLTSKKNNSLKNREKGKNLFKRIQRNLGFSSQQELLITAIKQIEMQYWNKYLFILINEIGPLPTAKKTSIENIKNSETYKKELELNSYLFHINSFNLSEEEESIDYFSSTIKYLKLFGTEELFKDHESHFDSYFLIAFIHKFLFHQFTEENIYSLESNLEELKNKGMETTKLIKFILSDHYFPKFDKNSIQFLLNLTEENISEINKIIYLIFLKIFFTEKKYRNSSPILSYDDFTIQPITNGFLKTPLKTTNNKEIIEVITKIYNIKNSQVEEFIMKPRK